MQSRRFVVTREALGPPGELQTTADTQIQARVVTASDGRSLLAAFTDRAAALSRGYTDFLIGLFAQTSLKLALQNDGLILNPSGPCPTEVSGEEIRDLLGQNEPN